MHFFGLHIFQGKYQEFLQIIKHPSSKTLVFTPNPEILLSAQRDAEFMKILKQATYLVPDAHGLYTASLMQEGYRFFRAGIHTLFFKKSLREKYGELMQGSNITRDIVQFASNQGKNILVIDNYKIHEPKNSFEKKKMNIQENLSALFLEKFPFLHVHIIFDGDKTPEEIAKIIQNENISYVFSCVGMKAQESRLVDIFGFLPEKFPVVGLGVGSSFDYLLGLQKRSPVIFQKMGLEWLYRLIKEPIRRGRRILDAIYYFPKLFRVSMTPESLRRFFIEKDIILMSDSIVRLSGGKDNITYRASLEDGRAIIIQCMRSIRNMHHASLIEEAIAFLSKKDPSLGFAPTPDGIQRFYESEECFIQVMDVVSGKNIVESDITTSLIKELAIKLGRFHKIAQDFAYEKYQDVNYHRDRLHEFRLLAERFIYSQENVELHNLLTEYTLRIEKLSPDTSLRKGLIHGDPVYKNFLLVDGDVMAWIDYDMMSITTQLWDLADMYRGYAKISEFGKEEANTLREAYESENPLSQREREVLPDYIRMMCLDTGYRYILALDPKSGFYNTLGDSLEKAKRCIRDHDRVDEWF